MTVLTRPPGPAPSRRTRRGVRLRTHALLLALLAPSFVLLVLFSFYPTFEAFFGSLFHWSRDNRGSFAGLTNYRAVLGDDVFWQSCLRVLLWAVWYFTLPFVMPLLVAEAIFNLRSRLAKSVFRIAILVPVLVPALVTTLLWRWIYSPDGGLNQLMRTVGLGGHTQAWLNDTTTAFPAMVLMGFPWIVGTAPLIYLAGLMTIPGEVIDATQIDGASTWRRIVSVDVPYILPQVRLYVIFGVISLLQNISTPLALTKGGPLNSTMVPGLYLYNKGFGIERVDKANVQLGHALAVGVLMFGVLLVLTLLTNRYVRDRSTEEYT